MLRLIDDRAQTSFWDEAVQRLNSQEKQGIDLNCINQPTILKDVLDAVEEKKELCLQCRWRFQIFGTMLEGLEFVFKSIYSLCHIRGTLLANNSPAKDQIASSVVNFYAEILGHLSSARSYDEGIHQVCLYTLLFLEEWPKHGFRENRQEPLARLGQRCQFIYRQDS